MTEFSEDLKDLVDLKDHCLLCFREDPLADQERKTDINDDKEDDTLSSNDAEEDEFGEISTSSSLCKRFLKLLARYLRLPSAELTVIADKDNSLKKVQTPWEDLITGRVCTICKELVTSFCDLYFQQEYIKIQMQNKIQDLEQCINFTDQDNTCNDARSLLGRKWESEGTNSQHLLKLLSILRSEILKKAARKKNSPMVSIRRMSDQEIDHHKFTIKEHRQSIEDSGISMYSGLSPTSSFEDSSSRDPNREPDIHSSFKQQVAKRTVFKCKKCVQKYFTREKLKTHAVEAHPKSANTESNNATQATAAVVAPIPQQRVCRIRKIAFICRAQNCDARFLSEQRLIDHVKDTHKNLTESFPKPLPSTSTADNCSETNATIENSSEAGTFSNEKSGCEPNSGNGSASPEPTGQQRLYKRRNFKCSFKGCEKKFHTPAEVLLHAQFHRKHPCSFCGEICKNPSQLAVHEYRFHRALSTDKSVSCPRCPIENVFPNYACYRAHFYATHLGVRTPLVKCPKCNQTFQSKSLKIHLGGCKPRIPASEMNGALSNVVSKSSESSNGTPTANKKATAAKPSTKYSCNICFLNCSSVTALQSHIIARHDPNISFCMDCERMFRDSEALNKHRAFIHLKFKVFMKFCSQCGTNKTFTSLAKFNAHVKSHEASGEIVGRKRRRRRTKCPTCHKKFRNLKTHMHVHAEKQPKQGKIKRYGESGETGDSISSIEHQEEPLGNDSINENECDASLADRVKRRHRSESRMSQPIVENFDEINTPKKRGRKRGRKPKILSTAGSNDNHNTEATETEHDETQQPNKRKKVKEADEGNEKIVQDGTPSQPSEGNELDKSVLLQPSSASENDVGNDNPEGQSTSGSSSITAPANSVKNTETDCVESPVIKQESREGRLPGVNERFMKWMATKELAQKLQSNATPTKKLTSSHDSEEDADCIILSGDEDDEEQVGNVEKKPNTHCVFLHNRVKSWLVDRQSIQASPASTTDSSDIEIITID